MSQLQLHHLGFQNKETILAMPKKMKQTKNHVNKFLGKKLKQTPLKKKKKNSYQSPQQALTPPTFSPHSPHSLPSPPFSLSAHQTSGAKFSAFIARTRRLVASAVSLRAGRSQRVPVQTEGAFFCFWELIFLRGGVGLNSFAWSK